MIETQMLYGDFNHDGEVNASDAAIMLIYAAEHGAGTFSGSFEEYVSKWYLNADHSEIDKPSPPLLQNVVMEGFCIFS